MSAASQIETAPFLSWLTPALSRLDDLLAAAVEAAERSFGVAPGADAFRGLHIGRSEVDRLLNRMPASGAFFIDHSRLVELPLDDASPLAYLAQRFGLTAFDVDVLLLAFAPEIDLRYERLFAYLQDDVSRRQPSVDLALTLFCETPEERLAARTRLGTDAPLVARRLLRIMPATDHASSAQLSRALTIDPQIAAMLLGDPSLDRRLAGTCRWECSPEPNPSLLTQASLTPRVDGSATVRIFLHGADADTRLAWVDAVAASAELGVVRCDAAAVARLEGASDLWHVALREAWLRGAVFALANADAVDGLARGALLRSLADHDGPVVIEGDQPWRALGATRLDLVETTLSPLTFEGRCKEWRRVLTSHGLKVPETEVVTIAGRFRLDAPRIASAVGMAVARASVRDSSDEPTLQFDDLLAAARTLTRPKLPGVAHLVPVIHDWSHLVLPDDTLAQLRELCDRAANRELVLDTFGFSRKLSTGRGVTALFTGGSGTGKTMAAQVIAGSLGLDLFRIDLAGVVSKYIGETEKNLDAIFTAAEHSSAILLFDEADAMFGKRSEVQDAHDRYANIEVSYLLQRMDDYEGTCLLSTNLLGSIDEAFLRRLSCLVHFPFPDEESRARIWRWVWPDRLARSRSVDLDAFARYFELSGGEIRNVVVAAAHLAAASDGVVTFELLRHALRREYAKLGRTVSDDELLATIGAPA